MTERNETESPRRQDRRWADAARGGVIGSLLGILAVLLVLLLLQRCAAGAGAPPSAAGEGPAP
ncbi:MAG: hypothetical protein ACPLRW_11640, partial [Moorellales bacterium]